LIEIELALSKSQQDNPSIGSQSGGLPNLPTCYILLPVHNRRHVTAQFIADLLQQHHAHYHLVLIDDGCQDGTVEMVQAELLQANRAQSPHSPQLTVLHGQGNWWWAGSLQQGIDWLKQQSLLPETVILMINDDVRIDSNFLATGLALLAQSPHTLVQAEGNNLLDRGVKADLNRLTFEPASEPSEINCLTTRGLFLHWQDLQHIGGFYPRWLPHYLSDFEFTLRAHRRGLQLMTDPQLSLWINPKTTGLHQLSIWSWQSLWQRYFSRRSSANKLDWSAFIVLACPWPRWLPLLLRIWLGGFQKLWGTGLWKQRWQNPEQE
jgi:GT2 family glycosyltransferase